jgi:hypothetical protein
MPQNGRHYVNGTSAFGGNPDTMFIEIQNNYPLILGAGRTRTPGMDGRAILNRSIKARVRFFRAELARGVFDDVRRRVARFPGVYTRP